MRGNAWRPVRRHVQVRTIPSHRKVTAPATAAAVVFIARTPSPRFRVAVASGPGSDHVRSSTNPGAVTGTPRSHRIRPPSRVSPGPDDGQSHGVREAGTPRVHDASCPREDMVGGAVARVSVRVQPANLGTVITHWPDMLRMVGSLVINQVRAYDLLRMFGREGHPTPLGQAFAEYGRIAPRPSTCSCRRSG